MNESKSNAQKINALKSEIQMLMRLLRADQSNQRLTKLSSVQKADADLKTRIITGLNEDQKNKLVPLYGKLRNQLIAHFEKNPKDIRCPITEWLWVLKELNALPSGYYLMIAKNDNAIYRWSNRLGEWEGFDTQDAVKELKGLKQRLEKLTKAKQKAQEFNVDNLTDIFDGKVM